MSDEYSDEESGSASYGVEIPTFKEWSIRKYYDFEALSADYTDLEELNRKISAASRAMIKLSESINKAERLAREHKLIYERTFNRKVIQSSEKTSSDKRSSAAILTEELENKYLYYDQLASELRRSYFALKEELGSLASIGHNLRQQIKVV